MRTNLGRWERIGSVAAGAGLLYFGTRRPATRRGTQMLGAGLLARGLTGTCLVKRAIVGDGNASTDTKRQLGGAAGIHVRESVIIRRPVEEVYRFWRDFGNLAKFLEHVERVDELGAGRSHWIVRGPGQMRFEWDAEIISDEPNELISWKTTDRADVVSAGSVIFRPLGREQTQVSVHFQYAPPGGKVARGVTALLGQDPDAQVREDLERLRGLLERRDESSSSAATTSNEVGHQPW